MSWFSHQWNTLWDDVGNWWNSWTQPIGHGIEQFWYNVTGQEHLTDKYQHEEERQDTAHQRQVQDLKEAGLSPFASVSGASSNNASAGQLKGLEKAAAIRSLMQQKANYSSTLMDNAAKSLNLKAAEQAGMSPEEYSHWAKYVGAGKGIINILEGAVNGEYNDIISSVLSLFDSVQDPPANMPTFPFTPVPSTSSKFISKHSNKLYVTKEGKKEFDNSGSSLYHYPWK